MQDLKTKVSQNTRVTTIAFRREFTSAEGPKPNQNTILNVAKSVVTVKAMSSGEVNRGFKK
jgi:hypothetical protein